MPAPETLIARAAAPVTDAAAQVEYVKTHAGLSCVPVRVFALNGLQRLNLSHNCIEELSSGALTELPQLQRLVLDHNALRTLPDDVARLSRLESLLLAHNKLDVLPESLCALSALHELDVSFNQLHQVSSSIGRMQALQVLNLEGNQLRRLPPELALLTGLRQLGMAANPDLRTPASVLSAGLSAVMAYLQLLGEQHQLVAGHVASFAAPLMEVVARSGRSLPPPMEEAGLALRLQLAQRLGVLSLANCRMLELELPPGLRAAATAALQYVRVLDASGNRLGRLPTWLLPAVPRLVVLALSDNDLFELPDVPPLLGQLGVLDVSFNRLKALPHRQGRASPGLRALFASNNLITAQGLGALSGAAQLEELFLSENPLGAVPPELSSCTALVKLSLATCRLSRLGDELACLASLRFLDLACNDLDCLPDSLRSLTSLAVFCCAFNPLGAFPDVLCYLTSLREVNLDHTGITAFPPGLGELRRLEGLQADGCPLEQPHAALYCRDPLLLVALHDTTRSHLDLSDCGLTAVPQQLLALTGLTGVCLARNAIRELPPWLGGLRNLASLGLRGNPLRQPYQRILDVRGERGLLALLRPEGDRGTLNTEGCGFETLPPEVCGLPGRGAGLAALVLTNNRLSDLPTELTTLVSLTRLVLDGNNLRQLPAPVLALPHLAVLMASQNALMTLPECISALRCTLQVLAVHGNRLSRLPASTSTLAALRVLGASGNRLWGLPPGMCSGCAALRLLDCSNNVLDALPPGLSGLCRLRSLKVGHNRLSWLPADELSALPHLEELDVCGNGLAVGGVDASATGAEAVARLLRAVAAGQSGRPPQAGQHSRCSSLSGAPEPLLAAAGGAASTGSCSSTPLPPALKQGRGTRAAPRRTSSDGCQRHSVCWSELPGACQGAAASPHASSDAGPEACAVMAAAAAETTAATTSVRCSSICGPLTCAAPPATTAGRAAVEQQPPALEQQPPTLEQRQTPGPSAALAATHNEPVGACIALDLPCAVRALLRPPAPPPPMAAMPPRPQTRARLHRVLDQTARALELLETAETLKAGT